MCGSDFQGGDTSGDGQRVAVPTRVSGAAACGGGDGEKPGPVCLSAHLCAPSQSLRFTPPAPTLLSPEFIVLSAPLTAGYCTSLRDRRIFLALPSVCPPSEGEREQDIIVMYSLLCHLL